MTEVLYGIGITAYAVLAAIAAAWSGGGSDYDSDGSEDLWP